RTPGRAERSRRRRAWCAAPRRAAEALRRGARGRWRGCAREGGCPAPTAAQEEEALRAQEVAVSNDAVERVRELMDRIASAAGVDASVEVREDGDGVYGEFVGDDLGLLIGHHGQTIDAIQHLAYRIAFRRTGAPLRVVVDAAGYRERRAVALRAAADQAAETAVHDQRPVALEAMSA